MTRDLKASPSMLRHLLSASLLLASLCAGAAPLVATLRQPESDTDPRQAYDHAVIRLALEKTVASHGPYLLQYAPAMNIQRALVSAEQRLYPGFLVVTGPDANRTAAGLVPVRFPLHLGAVGYRVCFVSPQAQAAVALARSLDELRHFKVAQGAGWADGPILRANGFQVEDVARYEAMFKMVSQGRVDLFCRSCWRCATRPSRTPATPTCAWTAASRWSTTCRSSSTPTATTATWSNA